VIVTQNTEVVQEMCSFVKRVEIHDNSIEV